MKTPRPAPAAPVAAEPDSEPDLEPGSKPASLTEALTAVSPARPPRRPAVEPPAGDGWRLRGYRVIFEAETVAGRRFDLLLIGLILTSVAVVMLDSFEGVRARYGRSLTLVEWVFTGLFTVEYLARLICVRRPWRYATSVFGVIDLVALLPTYLAFLVPDLHLLIDVRVLRLLRLFRILKLTAYVEEYRLLGHALYASRRKILVFMAFVMMVVLIMGTLMYVVEGPANGFTNIPIGVYWAITTMTTVGFGDITPKTDIGRLIASTMMLIGWGTLAVPTGIVSAEFTARRIAPSTTGTCPECLSEGHAMSARYCCDCGAALPSARSRPGARAAAATGRETAPGRRGDNGTDPETAGPGQGRP